MAMHFHFSKNKKPSQCSPKASHSGKNHQKSFHPSKSLQTPPNLPKPSKSPKIFPHLSKSPKITRNFPKTPKPLPQPPQNHPQTSPHPPQTHQNTSQILRNHPVRQISGQNLTPLSANSNTTFWKSGTSREPVGNQSGKSVHRPKRHKNGGFCRVLALFWSIFGTFCRVFPKNEPKMWKNMHFWHFSCLWGRCADFPDWFPTGSRRVPDGFPIRKIRCRFEEI